MNEALERAALISEGLAKELSRKDLRTTTVLCDLQLCCEALVEALKELEGRVRILEERGYAG